MSLDLKPEVEDLVREVVETGRYRDADTAVTEAMRLLRERDAGRAATLDEALDEGEADIREGRVIGFATKQELDDFFATL